MDKKEILDILNNVKDEMGAVPMRLVRQAFDKLVQPKERTEKRTETHACDLNKQAIDALNLQTSDDDRSELYDDTYDLIIHCSSQEEQDAVRVLLECAGAIPYLDKLPNVKP